MTGCAPSWRVLRVGAVVLGLALGASACGARHSEAPGAEAAVLMTRPDFDFTTQAVLSRALDTPLVPARNLQMSLVRGGLHVVGHSAGSIFAAHAIELLTGAGIPFRTLQLMAPAIESWSSGLQSYLGQHTVELD